MLSVIDVIYNQCSSLQIISSIDTKQNHQHNIRSCSTSAKPKIGPDELLRDLKCNE